MNEEDYGINANRGNQIPIPRVINIVLDGVHSAYLGTITLNGMIYKLTVSKQGKLVVNK